MFFFFVQNYPVVKAVPFLYLVESNQTTFWLDHMMPDREQEAQSIPVVPPTIMEVNGMAPKTPMFVSKLGFPRNHVWRDGDRVFNGVSRTGVV